MMPDLGKYAVPVLGSYAVAIGLIAAIVALSIWRSRRMKRALDAVEARAGRK
ncbi:heme exporter protein D [Gemmobacter caeni]|jgi:heme exporter protein D|uniref:Heme exporter protein D n=2 Tax=Gemmobacter TaxID=204456 RepID=A0A2T6BBU9_9RHOB|nr:MULTISPECIES: heme exporter protein CcmD [Gemmobacter]OJY27456.1 MAG: heme exporter protein CcmD [Rhodobacterales bacterium 65-51]PTX53534.1 heme exporter protein D [Gemmobacter caeni]TWJ05645.1 heme exporter protein D [Gemmobacter caeni]GHC14837.1 heme exporter protein D [Gemmobacter nanjingensis]